MQRQRLRFTVGQMMVGTAIVGLASWIVAGVVKDGTAWLGHHVLILVVAGSLSGLGLGDVSGGAVTTCS